MDKVKLGQITAPVGIKGEVKVFPYVDDLSRFYDITDVFVGENEDMFSVEKIRFDKGMAVIKFKEVPDRNCAELQRNKYLYLNKEDYDLEEDQYFLDELIGCKVISQDGEVLGVLSSVLQNTTIQDTYEIKKPDGKTFLVPAVKEFIRNIDLANKTITITLIEGLMD